MCSEEWSLFTESQVFVTKKQEGGEDNKEKGKVGCEFELKLVMIIKKTCEFRVSFPSPMKIWG